MVLLGPNENASLMFFFLLVVSRRGNFNFREILAYMHPWAQIVLSTSHSKVNMIGRTYVSSKEIANMHFR